MLKYYLQSDKKDYACSYTRLLCAPGYVAKWYEKLGEKIRGKLGRQGNQHGTMGKLTKFSF